MGSQHLSSFSLTGFQKVLPLSSRSFLDHLWEVSALQSLLSVGPEQPCIRPLTCI